MKSSFLSLALGISTATAVAADETDWRTKGLELVRAESYVVDAIWSQDISLWVSMKDDGSDRSGYAQVLCFSLRDAGRQPDDFVVIRIYDAAAMARDELRQIGRAECPHG